MTLRTLTVRLLPALRCAAAVLGHLAIAALGAAASWGFVYLAYRHESAQVREYRPAARLCSYDYDQAALWLAPLGALAASIVFELLRAAWRRRRRGASAPADRHGD